VKRGVPPGHDALRFKAGKLSALGGSGQRATGISFSGCGGDFGGLFSICHRGRIVMPNGESKNWKRFLMTLERFYILYDKWPTVIHLSPFS